jgi:hypothetical protein
VSEKEKIRFSVIERKRERERMCVCQEKEGESKIGARERE